MAFWIGAASADCLICHLDKTILSQGRVSGNVASFRFLTCDNHSQAGVKSKVQDIVERHGGELPIGQGSMQQPPTTSIVGERAQAVTAESGQDQQPSIDSLSEPRLTPTSKSPKKLPYRPADYIVQNLPPKTSDVSSNEPLILQTEKFLNLAYAWGQLELAKSALANAHDILMGIEKGELPVSTPKQRMREVRAIPKDMLVLVEEGEGGGEEKAEAE